jgi:hypothetical protein
MRHPAAASGFRHPRRWTAVAVWLAAVIAAFTVYLLLARTRAVNSDGASNALQARTYHVGPLHGADLEQESAKGTALGVYPGGCRGADTRGCAVPGGRARSLRG